MNFLSHLSVNAYMIIIGKPMRSKGKACGSHVGFNSVFEFDGQVVETAELTCQECQTLHRYAKNYFGELFRGMNEKDLDRRRP